MHCHVDLYPDYQRLIEECEAQCIYTLAVTNTPSVFAVCEELTRGRHYIRPAVGLHPELVAQRYAELDMLVATMARTRYIGEVGLDFVTTDADARHLQQRAFATIIEAAAAYPDRVLSVHSRRAAREVIEMIGPSFPGTVILHWYTGGLRALDQAVEYGFYFSLNPTMLASASGRSVAQRLPHSRTLIESDGPLASVDGRPARPSDGARVVTSLSKLWSLAPESVAAKLRANLVTALSRR